VTERLVVIGGDAAGMSAASQARRLRGVDDLEILAFERGPFTSFAACGIPYWIAGFIPERDQLIARAPEVFREKQDIDVRTRHEVVGIDTEARSVTVRDLDAGDEHEHGYDQLLVATGATPMRPPVPGMDAAGVLGVQTLEHGQQVLDALADRAPQRVVVIGAGYIGIEMAEAMKVRGLEVHVVDMAPQPMGTLDEEIGALVADAMRGMGLDLHLGVPVEGIETGDDGWVRAVATAEGTIDADLVVLGTGPDLSATSPVTPASRSVRAAGSSPIASSAPRSTACGPQATAPRPSTVCRSSRSRWLSGRSRTSRAASPV
jgi:NADPH-dependent 2,4-dienoyl-CoA reductase/sulfur reductase-like enzyme